MAHKTLVNGTSYDVVGGRAKVGGTDYGISGGRTKVGGTDYGINFFVPTAEDLFKDLQLISLDGKDSSSSGSSFARATPTNGFFITASDYQNGSTGAGEIHTGLIFLNDIAEGSHGIAIIPNSNTEEFSVYNSNFCPNSGTREAQKRGATIAKIGFPSYSNAQVEKVMSDYELIMMGSHSGTNKSWLNVGKDDFSDGDIVLTFAFKHFSLCKYNAQAFGDDAMELLFTTAPEDSAFPKLLAYDPQTLQTKRYTVRSAPSGSSLYADSVYAIRRKDG